MKNRIIIVAALLLSLVSCGPKGGKEVSTRTFPVPQVPAMVTDPAERMNYIASHYWDKFLSTDELLPSDSTMTAGVSDYDLEGAFSNYLGILGEVTYPEALACEEKMLVKLEAYQRVDTASSAWQKILGLADKYLYDPNSPMRNEELFLPFAKAFAASEFSTLEQQHEYAFAAQMCSLNRIGAPVKDFEYIDRNGRRGTLYGVKAEYTLLFFSNPGCPACKEIIDKLMELPNLEEMVSGGTLAIVNIYIDRELDEWRAYSSEYPSFWISGYDLNYIIREDVLYSIRAIPSLYLLDSGKRVLMKDAPEGNVLNFLSML